MGSFLATNSIIYICFFLQTLLTLHCREEAVKKFTKKKDPVEVLEVLRKEMDKFKKPKERLPPHSSLPPHAMLALEWGLLRP